MKIFNTDFEISLRILILLNNINNPSSIDYITTIDLFTTYGKNYNFLDYNLHGDSSFKFSEIASRRTIVNEALKELVIQGLIKANKNKEGFTYEITLTGRSVCLDMTSDYSKNYNEYSKAIIEKTSNMDELQLINYVTKQSIGGTR